MEYKAFPTKVMQVQNDREVLGLSAIMGVVDAGNDLIYKGAFSKTIQERGARVKHLWQHDNHQPPIATVVELKEVGRTDLPDDMKAKYPEAKGGLLVNRRYLDTPRGNEVLAGIKSDPPAITEMSFGYDPIKFDFVELDNTEQQGVLVRNLRELRLWDTSDVNWGMNEATVANVKSAVPYKDTGIAAEDVAWSKPNLSDFTDKSWDELSDGEKNRIAAHYAWSAKMPPESFGDLKLPHHLASTSGVGKAVWNGVKAAMGALMGARGGVMITDMQAVYNHLAKHYAQFDKEPPTMKTLELLMSIDNYLADDPKQEVVFEKLQELGKLLRVEPRDSALTLKLKQAELLRSLAIKQRQVSLIRA